MAFGFDFAKILSLERIYSKRYHFVMKKIIFLLTLMLASCSPDSARPVSGPPASAFQTINVYFYLNPEDKSECSSVKASERLVPKIKSIEIIALKSLFAGPNDEEIKKGFFSYFSADTADILLSFHEKEDTAYVDLKDIRASLPNLGTACSSAQFLAEMDMTIKQFGSYTKTVYAFNGSAEDFYEFLQMETPESFPDKF